MNKFKNMAGVLLIIIVGIFFYFYFNKKEEQKDNVLLENIVASTTSNNIKQGGKNSSKEENKNIIKKPEWGISFVKSSDWEIATNTKEIIVLKQVSGEWIGDTIDITYVVGDSITTTDAKFGNRTFYFDTETELWMNSGMNDRTGENENVPAIINTKNQTIISPVFVGTGRWLTFIIPMSHKSFVKLHITGSGQTSPLIDILNSLKKI